MELSLSCEDEVPLISKNKKTNTPPINKHRANTQQQRNIFVKKTKSKRTRTLLARILNIYM
jgi:hypothetical protein